MATIKLNNVTPSPGDTVSVPVLIQYGTEAGALLTGDPTEVSCTVWDEQGDKTPIARGTRAHLFVAPDRVIKSSPSIGMDFEFSGDYKLSILDTISQIKSDGLPLTDWVSALGNAYCFDYSNPYTRGCAVGLTNANGTAIADRFKFTRIDFTGRIDAYYYQNAAHEPWYYAIPATAYTGADWVQDGFDKNNMYSGYHKDVNSGTVARYDINKLKSALDPLDVETHSVECYRGLGFETDYYNEPCARDILVIVDWEDTMEYTVFDSWNESGFPVTKTVTGPKAFFAIAWSADGGSFETRLQVSDDPGEIIDIYPAAPAEEFEFIPLGGGGGGGGRKGKGGRAVSSSIPIRITSDGNIDYRHFLDLYDETNYNERNMFLTNFVGRIPYKLVEYEVSEGGINGTIRVSTDLQFTHFVGASFTDDNVPRVYEVISHRSMGGSPNVLLCTFRVCHLKDFFQHFGVTSDTEFLVQRSTNAALYNKWLQDEIITDEENNVDIIQCGAYTDLPIPMVVMNDNSVYIWSMGNRSDSGSIYTYVDSSGITHEEYTVSSYCGLLNTLDEIDNNPFWSASTVSAVNAFLSKIRAVYMIPATFAGIGVSTSLSVEVVQGVYTDPTDPTTLKKQVYKLILSGGTLYEDPYRGFSTIRVYTPILTNPINDWTDIQADYFLHIPWYGSMQISGSMLAQMLDSGNNGITVEYFISPLDGSITIANEKMLQAWKQLPTMIIPSSMRTQTVRQIREREEREFYSRRDSTNVAMWSSLLSTAGATALATITGNPLAAAGAIVSGASAIGIQINADIKNRNAMLGSNQAAQNVTFEALTCKGYEMLSVYDCFLFRIKKKVILNVYDKTGYPCRALWRNVGAVNGCKYWVTILGNLKGTAAYVQAVRGDIERDGIIYNYS